MPAGSNRPKNTIAMKFNGSSTKLRLLPLLALLFASCYDEYERDYDSSVAYFTFQKPLRTVIADRGMTIRVGMSIGGKRAVDPSDWATFSIDPTLLDGTPFELLPENYYSLSDPDTFRISNDNLAIADVTVSFTDAFYADPLAAGKHYALPFRALESSLDKINRGGESDDGLTPAKDYTIVAVRYISSYHGTYYVKGVVEELDASGAAVSTVIYENPDLSKNITRDFSTISARTVLRPGLADRVVAERQGVRITVDPHGQAVTVDAPDGYAALSETSGSYRTDGARPEFRLAYTYELEGKTYRVKETLVLRQDPQKDLRFEEW